MSELTKLKNEQADVQEKRDVINGRIKAIQDQKEADKAALGKLQTEWPAVLESVAMGEKDDSERRQYRGEMRDVEERLQDYSVMLDRLLKRRKPLDSLNSSLADSIYRVEQQQRQQAIKTRAQELLNEGLGQRQIYTSIRDEFQASEGEIKRVTGMSRPT